MNQAEYLGFAKVSGSMIPASFDFYWPAPPYAVDKDKAVLSGIGPRVAESGIGLITEYPFSAPYEDLALKPR